MRIATIFFLALLTVPAFALPSVHWQFATLPEEDAPFTLVTLEINDEDGRRTVPVGLCIGGPQDMELEDAPADALLHGGAWWAGQGQYWAVVPKKNGLQVSTRWADEGGPGGEGGGFGEWEETVLVPTRSQAAFSGGESVTLDLDRSLSLQKNRLNGDDVVLLQRLLALGGRGTLKDADGYFGPQTEARVKAFQKDQGLEADGIVGPKTWRALLVASSD